MNFFPSAIYNVNTAQSDSDIGFIVLDTLATLPRVTARQVIPAPEGAHRLIFFQSDKATLHFQKHRVHGHAHDAFLLAPGASADISFRALPPEELESAIRKDSSIGQAAILIFTFRVYRIGESQPSREFSSALPYETRIPIIEQAQIGVIAEEITDLWQHQSLFNEISTMRLQLIFQQLLLLVTENAHRMILPSDNQSAVKQTIAYIESHYKESFTATQLYRMAGVAKWQYSQLFQSLTGKKTLDFLLDIRLRHAKQLLVETSLTLAQIAKEVGFRDENYFSRKFKKVVGTSPRQYAKNQLEHVQSVESTEVPYQRIVAVGYCLGDLISLGITPIGADISIIGKRVAYREQLESIEDIGLLGEPSKIRPLQPDLIIHSHFRQDWIDELSLIAPTVLIDRYEPVYSRIVKVGELINRKSMALAWISRHKTAIENMWLHIASFFNIQQSAVIFSIVEGHIYVMGMKGFGVTLYHPKGFKPTEKVQELIRDRIPFLFVEFEQVDSYQADFHLILMDDDPRTYTQYEHLVNQPDWKKRSQKSWAVSRNIYNFDDPVTMDKLLTELPQILLQTAQKKEK